MMQTGNSSPTQRGERLTQRLVSRSGWRITQPWISLAFRLILGVVWVVFGAAKLGDLARSVDDVRAYQLLPPGVEPIVGSALPLLEVILGLILLVGAATRFAAITTVVLLAAYIVAIASAAARGLRINCGCLGSGGVLDVGENTSYSLDIARDAVLLLLAGVLALWPHSRWALEARFDRDDRLPLVSSDDDNEDDSEDRA